jgi:metal-responsive CopG/Arc/MetJ family transcriptional regulator
LKRPLSRILVTHVRPLHVGAILASVAVMSVQVSLPDDLAEQIDDVAADRTAFVAEAVRRLLRESSEAITDDEVARINEVADELNREAEDVLEYQVIS